MRKIVSLLFSLILLFFFSSPAYAQGEWYINLFNSDVKIQKTGEVRIVETIGVDFTNLSKHGIFRLLPYAYKKSDGTLYTNIYVNRVFRDSQKEKYTVSLNDHNIEIKIGDPEKTITGVHTYTIGYTVIGVLKGFSKFDEFYWNVNGNGWDVPVKYISSRVSLPEPILVSATCYVGYEQATFPCQENHSSSSAIFSARNLGPYQGLTIVLDYEKDKIPILNGVRPKTFFEKVTEPSSILIFVFPLLASIIFVITKWYRSGRDLWMRGKHLFDSSAREESKPIGAHETVVVEYTPPDALRPAEIGVLMDERADTLDVTSTIIDLATRGYIRIKEEPKKWMFGKTDYVLSQTKKKREGLLRYELLLLEKLFAQDPVVKLSSLKYTFYDELRDVKEALYKNVVEKKFFKDNPESIRSKYLIIAVILGLFSIFALVFIPAFYAKIFFAGLLVGSLVIFLSAKYMPRRTAIGRECLRRARGYYEFISHVEKYRQPFFEKRNMFSEVLPYAIVFGLTKKFAKAMDKIGIETKSPSWYTGTHVFNASNFTSSMNSFSSSMSSAMASSPSSSGSSGGSSGGGFGGGGGGSW